MKSAMLTMALLLASSVAFGQINFVGNDCNGQPHDLFAEMDQGKVIILCWVMPCGACTGPAKTSYNIVKSFQAQYPGIVLFYLVDDYGNTNCTSLASWANAQGLSASAFSASFSTPALKMSDYGAAGMPKVVIMGGPSHKIYYNANNQVNSVEMLSAINTAIGQTTDVQDGDVTNQSPLTVHPNPAGNEVAVSFTLNAASVVTVEFVNEIGAIMKVFTTNRVGTGPHTLSFDIESLPVGMYFVRVQTHEGVHVTKCIVSR